MSNDSLKIVWRGVSPGVKPQKWHEWPQSEIFKASLLEEKMDWPKGALAILRKACLHNLSRDTAWQAPTNAAFETAARVFKRGVVLNSQQSVDLSGQYPIEHCQRGQLTELISQAECIVVDRNVFDRWNSFFTDDVSKKCVILDVSEAEKNLDKLSELYGYEQFRLASSVCIIGGGVLGDLAGFAAALKLKSFTLIPTTLISMIDASVGGKTGVNLMPYGKNLLGLFSFPESVYVFPDFLATLSEREWNSGIFEGLKHAILMGDRELFAKIDGSEKSMDWPLLSRLIKFKADIVEIDPFENGIRTSLNFGHTLGHALEAYALHHAIEIKHGEGVGIGMKFALQLGRELNLLTDKSLLTDFEESQSWRRLEKFWREIIKERNANLAATEICELLSNDKKAKADDLTYWIIPKTWGDLAGTKPQQLVAVKLDHVKKSLAKFMT